MKVTNKSGFRGITMDEVEPTEPVGNHKFTVAEVDGKQVFTCVVDGGDAAVEHGKDDVQPHVDMKAGSTVTTWTDANGIQHAKIHEV